LPDSSFVGRGARTIGQIHRTRHHGAYKDSQYRTVYFLLNPSTKLTGSSITIGRLRRSRESISQRHKFSPILVAMELPDAVSCHAIERKCPALTASTSDD